MNTHPSLPETPNSPNLAIRVIKFGGSLLENPQSLELFRQWHASQAPAIDLVVIGGGVAVDQLRAWDKRYPFQPETVHYLAIEQMEFNARWLAKLMPDWKVLTIPSQSTEAHHCAFKNQLEIVFRANQSTKFLIDPLLWLANDTVLPRDWTVSSDSIAAHLARSIDANELVLLKSALPTEPKTRAEFCLGPWVDSAFAQVCDSVNTLRVVELTDPAFTELQFGPVTHSGIRS